MLTISPELHNTRDQMLQVTVCRGSEGLTVKQVLGEGVVGHELGDEQALVAVAAVADQVRHPPVAQGPHALGLLLQPNQTDRQKPASRSPPIP